MNILRILGVLLDSFTGIYFLKRRRAISYTRERRWAGSAEAESEVIKLHSYQKHSLELHMYPSQNINA